MDGWMEVLSCGKLLKRKAREFPKFIISSKMNHRLFVLKRSKKDFLLIESLKYS